MGCASCSASSFYGDWVNEETFVARDPLGNPVDQRHPWNQTTLPQPQKRNFEGGNYSWVMSPRWQDPKTGEQYPLETGGGPLARLWSTALSGLVDTPYVKATGGSVRILLPRSASLPETEFEWKVPQWCNTIERDRARIYFIAYAAGMALHFYEKAMGEVRAGRTRTFNNFTVPEEGIGVGFHEAVRGVLSHHLVIRDGKIANYHPYPPTCWNASPTDSDGRGRTDGGGGGQHPHLRGERRRRLQGDRHSAHRAQLRPLPALRGAHVSGRGEDAAGVAQSDDGKEITLLPFVKVFACAKDN